MPDFRAQQRDTSGIQKAYSRSKTADFINTGMAGVESGMQLAESMRVMKEKRQRAKQMATIMQSPEVKDSIVKLGVNPELFMASLQQDPTGTLKVLGDLKKSQQPVNANVNLQASGGIAGVDTLFGGGQPAVNTTPSAPEGYYAKELGKDLKPTKYVKKPEPKETPQQKSARELSDYMKRLKAREESTLKYLQEKFKQGKWTTEEIGMGSALVGMKETLRDMEAHLKDNTTALWKAKIPFSERYFNAILANFDKLAAIASGGKQLTDTELALIRSNRPTWQDVGSPDAIAYKFQILNKVLDDSQRRLEGGRAGFASAGGQPQEQTQNDDPMGLFK